MKQSTYFIRTRKELPKDADSKNAAFLTRGGYIDKLMSGVFSYLPLGLRVIKKIENIVREEINKIGGQELLMPVMGPKENWQKTGRFEALDILYKLKSGDGKEVVLNPTHEEIIVPLAKSMITLYKDLPLYLYQIQDKFRNEKRAKSGLLRGREFLMKDLYSFHADKNDLEKYYNEVSKAYKKIFACLGIGSKTVLTYASGGSFSKYSHEFQTITENGEDEIYLCEKCNQAINKEIISEQKNCPKCNSDNLKIVKAIEVGNIFQLGIKYSQPFELKITNKKGKEVYVEMGCYGLGISRVMGAIVEVLAEEKKIIWPKEVAPFKYHLISLNKNQESQKVYQQLLDKNVDVLFDDRDASAGEKFAEADLIGAPTRIIISEKSLASGGAEVVDMALKNQSIVLLSELINKSN